jgi:hypothetical protein
MLHTGPSKSSRIDLVSVRISETASGGFICPTDIRA